MVESSKFDVFLAHNSADKLSVRAIAFKLKQRGLEPWLDEEQIPPGRSFQDEIQQAIPLVKSAAIFLGLEGLGSWQSWELRALISSCVKKNIPVIPILLPGVSSLPEHLLFLEQFRWVSFDNGIGDENALYLLEWGITGQKPETIVKVIPQPFDVLSTPKSPNKTKEILFLGDIKIDDDLSSARAIDYTRLRDLLAAQKWKEADYETYLVMLSVVGRKKGDWFGDWIRDKEVLNFPCTDLRTIDSLWVKYSNGRFGFSVQKNIYLEVSGIPNGEYHEEAWRKFGDHVGWVKRFGERVGWMESFLGYRGESWITFDEVIYDTTASNGHLPTHYLFEYYSDEVGPNETWNRFLFFSLASRLVNCNL